MNTAILTFDTDWAPDFVIDAVAEMQRSYGVPATWFVTHESPAIDRLREEPELFELGIHPNFLPNSSHGTSVEEVLQHVMSIVPEAVSMRTHGVYQSGALLSEVARSTPVKIDSTTFLPLMPDLAPVIQHTPHGTLIRAPFIWSDDYEELRPPPRWTTEILRKLHGLKVLLFHPMRVYLNVANADGYRQAVRLYPRLQDVTQEELARFTYTKGTEGDFFVETLEMLSSSQETCRLQDLSTELV